MFRQSLIIVTTITKLQSYFERKVDSSDKVKVKVKVKEEPIPHIKTGIKHNQGAFLLNAGDREPLEVRAPPRHLSNIQDKTGTPSNDPPLHPHQITSDPPLKYSQTSPLYTDSNQIRSPPKHPPIPTYKPTLQTRTHS